jgi:hypothetical protein
MIPREIRRRGPDLRICALSERTRRAESYLMKDWESRLATRVQLTTDGLRPYANAVDMTLGTNVDYAMLA